MDSSIHSDEREQFSNILPVGVILPYARDIPPEGFMICNGCTISRNLYKLGEKNSDFFKFA